MGTYHHSHFMNLEVKPQTLIPIAQEIRGMTGFQILRIARLQTPLSSVLDAEDTQIENKIEEHLNSMLICF